MGAIKRRSLEQLYSGPQVLEIPLDSAWSGTRKDSSRGSIPSRAVDGAPLRKSGNREW